MNVDKKAVRIQVSAEEARKNRAAAIEYEHQQKLLNLEVEDKKLLLKQKKRQDREKDKQKRKIDRRIARQNLARRVQKLMPTVGRRVMIAGPILAPMAVAWIGQIGFATHTLKWPLLGGLVFAAAWELTTAFSGWMYHQARSDGDRGTLFRIATWVFASSAGAMNYWHALGAGVSVWKPTPKAVSYGAMSLVGIALWELYSSLIHSKHLRAEGKVSSARPRFGILRWLRFSRITWTAWSLSVRYGIQTVDAAWSQAVAEVERRDHLKKLEREQKRLAKDKRPAVRVTVVRVADHTFAAPKTTLRLYRVDRLATTYDHPAPTIERPVVATTPTRGLPAPATTDHTTTNDRPQADSDHPATTTTATTGNDHYGDRSDDHWRPRPKTTRKTGRDQAVTDQTKAQPTTEDNKAAVNAYLDSVKAGRPLSQRALAKQFGFSKTWARDRIQEAGPQPVGGGRRTNDHPTTTTPKDHPATSEVKTG